MKLTAEIWSQIAISISGYLSALADYGLISHPLDLAIFSEGDFMVRLTHRCRGAGFEVIEGAPDGLDFARGLLPLTVMAEDQLGRRCTWIILKPGVQ